MASPSKARRGAAFSLALILALVLALTGAGRAAAQLSTASVEVSVTDEAGQPLPGVGVAVTNVETGFSRQATTGAKGGASLTALPPGTYRASFDL